MTDLNKFDDLVSDIDSVVDTQGMCLYTCDRFVDEFNELTKEQIDIFELMILRTLGFIRTNIYLNQFEKLPLIKPDSASFTMDGDFPVDQGDRVSELDGELVIFHKDGSISHL